MTAPGRRRRRPGVSRRGTRAPARDRSRAEALTIGVVAQSSKGIGLWRLAILLAVVLLVGACGDESEGPTGDPRPRVEGRWRVVMTSRSGREAPGRATWNLTPACRYGACDFSFRGPSGKTRKLRFDKIIGDYTGGWAVYTSCENLATGEVIAKKAYKVKHKVALQVATSVRYEGRAYATEMTGEEFAQPLLQPAYEGQCQEESPATFDLRVVRADPPPGTRRRVTPAGGAPSGNPDGGE